MIIKNVTHNFKKTSLTELYSDHNPVQIEIEADEVRIHRKKKWTDWKKFENNLVIKQTKINDKNDIEKGIKNLQGQIEQTLKDSTTNIYGNKQKTLPQHILEKIQKKNKARKQYFITLSPQDTTILNKLNNEVNQKINN